MGNYKLSPRAEEDLVDIYLYSLDEFGPVKAENYYRTIETKIKLLAGQPGMGERCDNIRPGAIKSLRWYLILFFTSNSKMELT